MDVREKLVELLITLLECETDGDCSYLAKDWAETLIANGVTVQEQDGCEHCRAASYTENPFTVITQMGREVKTQFNFCPNCGRRLLQQPAEKKKEV